MWAASPARKSLPYCMGSQIKERICTMFFSKILPSASVQSSSLATRVHLLPNPIVGPVVYVVLRVALEVEALYLWGARAHQRKATLVKGVDQLLRRRRSLDEDAEPAERVGPDVLLANLIGDGGPTRPEEAIAPGHEVAGDLLVLRIPVEADPAGIRIELCAPAKADLRRWSIQVAQAGGRRPDVYLPSRLQPGGVEILDDLLLPVDPDLTSASKLGKVDPVAATTELQVYAVVDGPLVVHPLSDARLLEQFGRSVLEHPGPDRRLYHFAAPELEHHRLDAFQMQEVREQRPCRPAPDDTYLCAHRVLPPQVVWFADISGHPY